MARQVRIAYNGPIRIQVGTLRTDKHTSICACGLTQTPPWCDGSHKITASEQPGMLYIYSPDGKTVLEVRPDPCNDPPVPPFPPPQPPPAPSAVSPPTPG